MKYSLKIVRILILLTATLFLSNQIVAQINPFGTQDLSKVQIGNYSDEDLLALFNRAQTSGITESQLLKMAAERGMSSSEINKLRNRIQHILNKNPVNKLENSEESPFNPENRYDSSQNIPTQRFENDQTIFGSELFTSSSLVFEPNLRIPAPKNYILGPDDELIISVYGYSEKKYTLRVNEIGEIYIPNVGPILVSGLTLEEATEKIKNKLGSTIYRAINSGQTKVQITLGKIRSIRVTVIGQAKKPGTYTVSSLTTLFNILYLVGGPTDMGSYRDIEIIRGSDIKRTADLYDFLVNGSQKDNALLQEGDVIRIPYYKKRVTLTGEVKREGKFEMLDNETFSNLLNYSGGFTDVAYRGAVTVERVSDSERIIIDLPLSQYSQFAVKGSDDFIVGRIQEQFGNRIYATGSVQRPGPYELKKGLSVKELIENAGGLTPDAYSRRAIIYRYYQNMMPAIISVSLDSIFNFGQVVYLQKNDSLVVPSIFEFHDKSIVTLEGYVRKPGALQWRDHITLREVLLASGGITEIGDSSTIEISRRVKNAKVEGPNHVESEIINVNLTTGADEHIFLQPFDLIIVKSKPGYTVQRSVIVQGQVKAPGKYALENSASTVADVIRRTGGFKASADSSSLTIRRINSSTLTREERERLFQRILNINHDSLANNPALQNELYKSYDLISVNLKNATEHPESSDNLRLEDGDILSIMRNTKLVKISGEVYYPTLVPYRSGKSLKYYVEQAGNFMPNARKTGALVIHPDGKVASVKHFLFFKSYPSVTPRSEIFVPQKIKSNRIRLGTGELALIVSALGILANVIINVSK